MQMTNVSVQNLIERYLTEGKRTFVYEIVGGFIKITEALDIDEKSAREIASIIDKEQFNEKMVQHDSYADVGFRTESVVVKYKGKLYLIENKKRDTYIKVYMYYQVTPVEIIEIV